MEKTKCLYRNYQANTRGQLFVKDNDNVGKKMLKKMGWSQGKGLGKDMTGDTEIINVRQKLNTNGMGYQGNHHNWIANQENFDSILSSLQEHHSVSGESGSENHNSRVTMSKLEMKSKTSKSRVHYNKLMKSKDLSSSTKEEMESIFGSQKLRSKIRKIEPEIKMKEETETAVSSFVSQDSVAEYFAKKLAKKRLKLLEADNITNGESIENDQNGSIIEAEKDAVIAETDDTVGTKKRKKRKKKKSFEAGDSNTTNAINSNGCDNPNSTTLINQNGCHEPISTIINHNDSMINKKKRKRKQKKDRNNLLSQNQELVSVQPQKKRRRIDLLQLECNLSDSTLSRKNVSFNEDVEVFYVPAKDKTRGGALRLMKDSDWVFYDE